MKAGIVGATGYGGAELVRILLAHPEFTIASIYTSSQQGRNLEDHYPHLTGLLPQKLEEINPKKMAQETDVIFLATPSGISSTLAPKLIENGCSVIDLSGDFRLQDEMLYEKWYKKAAADQEWLKKAVYCLPELHREHAKGANFIANPGCYPTATLLGLAPLVKEKIICENSIIVDAKSGVSGAGQSASLATIYSELNENLKVYKVNQHQHIPEIEQNLSSLGYHSPITFQTHLIPMTRGIMATIYGRIDQKITKEEVWQLYQQSYSEEAFVRVRKLGTFPTTKEVAGSNFCDIGIDFDERTSRVTIVSVIDNLMKGAASQAVQNANIMFGFDEQLGLNYSPVYP